MGITCMQEGDPEGWWQETFKGHVDSKPRGPEGISFDLAFPGAQHVYGLPEHATSLALKPTVNLREWPLLIPQHDGLSSVAMHARLLCKPSAPEKASSLDAAENVTSEPYRLYNLDVFEYAATSPFGLYGSIPIMWAQKPGLTVGAFWCAQK